MIVYNQESTDNNFIACYNSTTDTLVFPEELLNELNTTLNNTISPLYWKYVDEMEKIQAGDLTNTTMVKLDEFLGSIGLIDTTIINKGSRIDGLC